jgi:uncharacterized membrane protein
MKIFGILFVVFGGLFAFAGFLSSATDIQLGIGISGLCMVGIGVIMIGISSIQRDLVNVWLWVKKLEKDEN